MTNYIGIVGSSKATTTQEVVDVVCNILDRYDKKDTVIVSGGANGIDRIAIDIASALGYDTIEYLPRGIGWQYYKPRNILIANKCDKVYSIALPLSNGSRRCYHCGDNNPDSNNVATHTKTAGCWTAHRCQEYEVLVA